MDSDSFQKKCIEFIARIRSSGRNKDVDFFVFNEITSMIDNFIVESKAAEFVSKKMVSDFIFVYLSIENEIPYANNPEPLKKIKSEIRERLFRFISSQSEETD